MSPVEACPIQHTVKQLTMILNALLASAESAFGAHVRAHAIAPTALTAAPVDLKMNANHFQCCQFSYFVARLATSPPLLRLFSKV